jgi:hypothetical protein
MQEINEQAVMKHLGKLNTFRTFYHLLFQEPEFEKRQIATLEIVGVCWFNGNWRSVFEQEALHRKSKENEAAYKFTKAYVYIIFLHGG